MVKPVQVEEGGDGNAVIWGGLGTTFELCSIEPKIAKKLVKVLQRAARSLHKDPQEELPPAKFIGANGSPFPLGVVMALGDGTGGGAFGISFVQAHPHLLAVTSAITHQVRMYDHTDGRLLCKLGKEGGSKGQGAGEFNRPWGVMESLSLRTRPTYWPATKRTTVFGFWG
jgi:hypothetical protein